MFKLLIVCATFTLALLTSSLFASCAGRVCQSVDVEVGWRRDSLDWKTDRLRSSYINARVDDHILFKDINSYTISAQANWVSSDYYIRLSGQYGTVDKGRAHERFNIHSSYLLFPLDINTSDPIKRRSEVYDFDAALGYPFTFFCCRLNVIPLIGFSFHRQHLRVKEKDESSSCCFSYYDYPRNSCEFFQCHSSSSFFVESSNPFIRDPSSNPFGSPSSPSISSDLGLSNPHRTDTYRFTWYGFYLGADIAYAIDCCWTLFWDTEFHFFDNCHRKRKSWTGVYFVDSYHKKGSAYGFNNIVGLNYRISDCWYATLSVDFNWWKAHSKHDELHWKKVGAKIGLGYPF